MGSTQETEYLVEQIRADETYQDKEKYRFLSFALQLPNGKIKINPAQDEPVTESCGIWLIDATRPLRIQWPE